MSRSAASQPTIEQVEAFRKSLQTWVSGAVGAEENREEAARRMVAVYEDGETRLSLNDLGLTTLPDAIGSLTGLAYLDLSSNQLTTLPDTIGSLIVQQNLVSNPIFS